MSFDTILGVVGVLLGLTSIGVTVFLYVHNIATRLDQLLQGQQSELEHIGGELTKSQHDTVARQRDALVAFQAEILHRLQDMHERQEGTLSGDQASHLANLYLDSVSTHLERELARAAASTVGVQFMKEDAASIMTELRTLYRQVVIESIRPRVAPFKLRNRQNFSEFVRLVNQDAVSDAFIEIENMLREAIRNHTSLDIFMSEVREIVRKANDEGRDRILRKLDELYPTVRTYV